MALFCCLRFGDMLRVTRFFGHSSHYLQRLSATAEQCAVVCIAVSGIFTRQVVINHLPGRLIGTSESECVAASCLAKGLSWRRLALIAQVNQVQQKPS